MRTAWLINCTAKVLLTKVQFYASMFESLDVPLRGHPWQLRAAAPLGAGVSPCPGRGRAADRGDAAAAYSRLYTAAATEPVLQSRGNMPATVATARSGQQIVDIYWQFSVSICHFQNSARVIRHTASYDWQFISRSPSRANDKTI